MMSEERSKELLETIVGLISSRFELDTAVEFMARAGFSREEMAELGYEI